MTKKKISKKKLYAEGRFKIMAYDINRAVETGQDLRQLRDGLIKRLNRMKNNKWQVLIWNYSKKFKNQ